MLDVQGSGRGYVVWLWKLIRRLYGVSKLGYGSDYAILDCFRSED
jgi:hypothetical protein